MHSKDTPATPYGNIRILDMSRVLAGPWAGQLLADLGAEVIKIERPGRGDDSRHWGPPFLHKPSGEATQEAAYYLCANRGKKSTTIDISHPSGQALVKALAAQADVLIENYKVGDLERYGLGYEDLKAINPDLIYCSVTGFGQTGPWKHLAGYDFLIQAVGGVMSLTGHGDAEPGGGPVKVGVPVTDIITGLYATVAIQAALARRAARGGGGDWIDLALLDCQIAMLANQGQNYLSGNGSLTPRMGNAHPNVAPYEVYPTADGHMVLAVGTDYQFAKCCQEIGHPLLVSDPLFVSNSLRVQHRRQLNAIIGPVFRQQTTQFWMETLGNAGVPCGPINNLDQVYALPQVKARDMVMHMDHSLVGPVPVTANPIHYKEHPIHYQAAPPELGQHTDEVLSNLLGLSESDIAKLRQESVI